MRTWYSVIARGKKKLRVILNDFPSCYQIFVSKHLCCWLRNHAKHSFVNLSGKSCSLVVAKRRIFMSHNYVAIAGANDVKCKFYCLHRGHGAKFPRTFCSHHLLQNENNSCILYPFQHAVAYLSWARTRTIRATSARSWPLTHWGRDKMADFRQTTFSNVFSWMKMLPYWFKFHWNMFLDVQLTSPIRRQAII